MAGMWMALVAGVGLALAESPTPTRDGLLVGGATAGGEVGGLLVGGALGLGLGAAACRLDNGFECYTPLIGVVLGGAGGTLAGGVLAGGWASKRLGHDPRRVRRWGLLTIAGGATLFGVGAGADVDALQFVGLYGTAVGLPVVQGLATGTDPGAGVTVAPLLGAEVQGLQLSGRF